MPTALRRRAIALRLRIRIISEQFIVKTPRNTLKQYSEHALAIVLIAAHIRSKFFPRSLLAWFDLSERPAYQPTYLIIIARTKQITLGQLTQHTCTSESRAKHALSLSQRMTDPYNLNRLNIKIPHRMRSS
jgi:hypothetical protein